MTRDDRVGFGGAEAGGTNPGNPGLSVRRMVRFPDEPAPIETRIVARDSLAAGARLAGPAIVEQDDTTTLIPPGWTAVTGNGGIMALVPDLPTPVSRTHD